jgi:hypothetical protein
VISTLIVATRLDITGGLAHIKVRQWTEIAKKLGFAPKKSIGLILKSYYERYLHPFELFKKGQAVNAEVGIRARLVTRLTVKMGLASFIGEVQLLM